MSKEIEFVPMPVAQTRRLRTKARLPFGVEDSIGLNIKHIQLLCQIAGFRHLTIENQEDPEISSTSSMMVGIDSQGVGIAGKGVTTKVPTFNHEFQSATSKEFTYKNSRWQDLTISLNTEEIKQRMLSFKEDVRNVKKWTAELNGALAKGIVRSGLKQLLTNLKKSDLILPSLYHSISLQPLLGGNVESSAFWFMFNAVWLNVLCPMTGNSFMTENFEEGEGYRVSMFVNFELDRAAALLFMAGLQPLAGEIKQEGKN